MTDTILPSKSDDISSENDAENSSERDLKASENRDSENEEKTGVNNDANNSVNDGAKKSRKRLVKRFIIAAQYLLVFAILWLIWGKLGRAWEQIQSADYKFTLDWLWLAAGGVIYAFSLPFPASYWYCALRHLGQTPSYYATLRAHIVGHLGKYIPGKIFVVLIRSGLLRGDGVDTTVCVLSIFLEGLMQMAVGALVVAGLILGWAFQSENMNFFWGSLLLFCIVGLPILPPFFKLGVKIIGVKKFSEEVRKVDRLSWKTFLFGVPLMLGYWTLLGASFWCVLRGVGLGVTPGAYPAALVAIAASMVAGFVIVVSPGGMGVREAIIVMLITASLKAFTPTPDAAALVSACVLRILWIAVELLCAGGFYMISGKNGQKIRDNFKDCIEFQDRKGE